MNVSAAISAMVLPPPPPPPPRKALLQQSQQKAMAPLHSRQPTAQEESRIIVDIQPDESVEDAAAHIISRIAEDVSQVLNTFNRMNILSESRHLGT
jgi:hypothetical protein